MGLMKKSECSGIQYEIVDRIRETERRVPVPEEAEQVVAAADTVANAATATRLPGHQHHFFVGAALHAQDHKARVDNFELGFDRERGKLASEEMMMVHVLVPVPCCTCTSPWLRWRRAFRAAC